MRQRFILVALSCPLRIHSADKISRKNLVLSEKSRPTLVKELKSEEKKGGAVKHGHFTGIETGALFKSRRYFGGRKYMKRQRTRKKIKKWMLQELISIYSLFRCLEMAEPPWAFGWHSTVAAMLPFRCLAIKVSGIEDI